MSLPDFGFDALSLWANFVAYARLFVPTMMVLGVMWGFAKLGVEYARRFGSH